MLSVEPACRRQVFNDCLPFGQVGLLVSCGGLFFGVDGSGGQVMKLKLKLRLRF